MTIKSTLSALLFLATTVVSSQNLLNILEKERSNNPTYAEATFSHSRITFGQSTQTRKKGVLDVFVSNRFWNTPADRSQSFIADRMSARIAVEYGITDHLLFGLGGTTFDGRFDGFLKYNVIKQRTDGQGFPFNVTLLQNTTYFSEKLPVDSNGNSYSSNNNNSNRFSFTTQILISRKINSKLSLQLAPTFVKRGLEYNKKDPQEHFALGLGGRYKLGKHVSLVSEYYYVTNPIKSFDTYGPFSIGVNWQLSRVMVQLMLTNALNMTEDAFITETRNNFNFRSPNLNFGFNFTYTFHLSNALID